ncbi:MAG TPA: FAD-dependent oxidoreductase [Solirubrobacterales bacterium]|nr:FAD-dependent oxidoreductase [Solirubrobacterales bacterium]
MEGSPRVAVIGAGIAGLVAGYALATRGFAVTVVEAGAFPGGRTTSWTDAAGHERDTAPHLVVDHYVNFLDVLGDLGLAGDLVWMRRPMYLRSDAPPAEWQLHRGPAALHLLAPARNLSPRMLPRVAMAGLGTLTLPEERLRELDAIPYSEWQHGVVGDRLDDLADAASEAACFLPAAEASAYVVLSWLRTLMRTPTASHVASWPAPFEEAFVGPLVAAIEQRGGRVRTATAAVGVELEDERVRALTLRPTSCEGPFLRADGAVPLAPGSEPERLPCDFAISAVPPQAFGPLLGEGVASAAGVEEAVGLPTTPALSVTLWLDRPVGPAPDCPPMCDSPAIRGFIDWASIDRRGADDPAVVQLVLAEPRRQLEMDDEAIVAKTWAEYKALWPPAREAVVVDRAVERIDAAMVACVPGSFARRPGAETKVDNLFLAGDWTTPHDPKPSMEAATISGRHAADGILRAAGRAGLEVLDPPQSRVLGLGRRIRAKVA